VQAHLIGGVPIAEVTSQKVEFEKFGVDPGLIFESDREGYNKFKLEIGHKDDIRRLIEASASLQETYQRMNAALNGWWKVAQHDFAKLEGNNILAEVLSELMQTLKDQLVPIGVLDEFKAAGVFVNWWQTIRYDLKTIISMGWSHVLIPDQYLVAAFFQGLADEISDLESRLSEAESQIEEAIETVDYEADEDETVSSASLQKYLKSLIDDLKGNETPSAVKERQLYEEQRQAIVDAENCKKEINVADKAKQFELQMKLSLKRLGAVGEKQEATLLLKQINSQMAGLDANDKEEKKRINVLKRDQKALQERLGHADALMAEIGGQLTPAEAKDLILKKLYDAMQQEMLRYLNAEKRAVVAILDKLYDKYFLPFEKLKEKQANTDSTLSDFLNGLGYLQTVRL